MFKYRYSLLPVALFSTACAVAAATWNSETLQRAKEQATAEVNEYLQQQTGPVSRYIDKATYEWIQTAQYSLRDKKQLNFMTNPLPVLDGLAESAPEKDSIGLQYLAVSFADNKIDRLIRLYKNIIYNNPNNLPFALAELAKISSQFDEKQNDVYQELLKHYRFALTGINVKRKQEQPQLCLQFSQTVLPPPEQQWQNYIHFTPDTVKNPVYKGDELCYDGNWQTQYTLHVDKALLGQYRLPLYQNTREQTVNTGNRAPMVRFADRGKTLVRSPEATLTVESANTDTVYLQLWQVPANNLAGEIRDVIEDPEYVSRYRLRNNAVQIWQGSFNPDNLQLNQTGRSHIRFNDMLGNKAPSAGVYVAVLTDRTGNNQYDLMGFTVTDRGFSVYKTDTGITAELRSLTDNRPIADAPVLLYAYNNRILAQKKTDAQGIVRFSDAQTNGKDSDEPGHLINIDHGHLAYLSIRGQGIDLSDKGLSGALSNPTLTHWSWHDRGVYRPGETLHALWLFKTPDGKPFTQTPVWLEIRRPDNILMYSRAIAPDASGAYLLDYPIAANARLGTWQIRIRLGKDGAPLVNESYQVDSIIPRQIESTLSAQVSADRAQLNLKANWLYGAPAAQLPNDGSWSVGKADALTAGAWQGWQIGRYDEQILSDLHQIPSETTDANGTRTMNITFTPPFATGRLALSAFNDLTAPNAGVIHSHIKQDIPRSAPYIALEQDDDGSIRIAALNDRGTLLPAKLQWTLYRVQYNGYWYQNGNIWDYRYQESRIKDRTGKIETDGKTPAALALELEPGEYVIDVQGQLPQTAASLKIRHDWFNSANHEPSALTLISDKQQYLPGETVHLTVKAPFDGAASVKTAIGNILKNYPLTLKNQTATLDFVWPEGQNQGIWLLANAWNSDIKAHNRRAVGLTRLKADISPLTLNPEILTTAQPQPEKPLHIQVHVPYAPAHTYVNIAVVDDGLYRLSAPSFTDPKQAFYGKKQPDISFYDNWGNLIRQTPGLQAALRSGAGEDLSAEAALNASPDPDLVLIADWSKPQPLDAQGNTEYDLTLPHYNGRLRIMSAAFSPEKIGSQEKTVIVQAPVVSELYSPYYLSPGDSSTMRLRLHNTTAAPQTLQIKMQAEHLQLSAPAEQSITLAPDASTTLRYPFKAAAPGTAQVQVNITGTAQPQTITRHLNIRPQNFAQIRRQYRWLLPQTQNSITLTGLQRGHLSFNPSLPYDAAALRKQLADYPLGCSEQTGSKLWGLLSTDAPEVNALNSARNRLANLAYNNGGYALWGYGKINFWLSAYVSEALLALNRYAGSHNGSDNQLQHALDYLQNHLPETYLPDSAAADSYAYLVLAKAGRAIRGDLLRYNQATERPGMNSALDLAVALAQIGEYQAAGARLDSIDSQKNDTTPYGSTVSTAAHNLVRLQTLKTLWQAVDTTEQALKLKSVALYYRELHQLAAALQNNPYLSTQDLAWLVRLADTVSDDRTLTLNINGKSQTLAQLRQAVFNGDIQIQNPGTQPVWLAVNDLYTPPAGETTENGWKISMRYQDTNGKTLDPGKLPLNSNIRVTAEFIPTGDNHSLNNELLFVYPLPAGVMASPIRHAVSDNSENDPEADNLLPEYQETRDDRYIAAFTLPAAGTFRHSFYIRTTTAGEWHAPGFYLENMYEPQQRAAYPERTVIIE